MNEKNLNPIMSDSKDKAVYSSPMTEQITIDVQSIILGSPNDTGTVNPFNPEQ